MIIERLIAALGYELDPKSEAEKEKYEKGLEDMSKATQKLTNIASKAVLGLGAFAATVGVVSNATAKGNDEILKFSEATDVTTDDVQRLTHATEIYGGTQDTLFSSLEAVTEKLGEFRRGAGDLEVLGQLGVGVGGGDTLQFLERLADRFQNLDAQQAQDLGKKLGLDANFTQLLRQGSTEIRRLTNEADSLGIESREALERSAEFIDSQTRLRRVLGSIQNRVVSGLIPNFTETINKLVQWTTANRDLIESGITEFIEVGTALLKAFGSVISFVVGLFFDLVDVVGSVKNALITLGIAYAALKIAGNATLLGLLLGTTKLSAATVLLNARILLIPVLIAAAIGAALLVLQDFFTFLQGGDSVIGRTIDSFKEWKEEFRQINEYAEALAKIMDGIAAVATFIGEAVGNTFGAAAEAGRNGDSFTDAFGDFFANRGRAIVDTINDVAGTNLAGGNDSTVRPSQAAIDFARQQQQGQLNAIANFGGGATDRREVVVDVNVNGATPADTQFGDSVGAAIAPEAVNGARATNALQGGQ